MDEKNCWWFQTLGKASTLRLAQIGQPAANKWQQMREEKRLYVISAVVFIFLFVAMFAGFVYFSLHMSQPTPEASVCGQPGSQRRQISMQANFL